MSKKGFVEEGGGGEKKRKTRVWADPKSLSYSAGNVFIYKQLEDKP